MRVPRRTQELARDVATATGEISQQRGRCPTLAELADHLQVSSADVLVAIGASQVYRLTSLNAPYAGTGGDDLIDLVGGIDPRYAGVDDRLLLRSLRPLFAALPLRGAAHPHHAVLRWHEPGRDRHRGRPVPDAHLPAVEAVPYPVTGPIAELTSRPFARRRAASGGAQAGRHHRTGGPVRNATSWP
jgi:hypothetical protein